MSGGPDPRIGIGVVALAPTPHSLAPEGAKQVRTRATIGSCSGRFLKSAHGRLDRVIEFERSLKSFD